MTVKQQGFDLDHISESQPKVCPSAPDCRSALAKRVTGGKLSLPRRELLSRCEGNRERKEGAFLAG